MLQVPYAVADYWRRQAKQAREERGFWRAMTYTLSLMLMPVAFRRYHMHLWEALPIVCLWLLGFLVLSFVTDRRERKRDEWTRRHV